MRPTVPTCFCAVVVIFSEIVIFRVEAFIIDFIIQL